MAIEPIRPARRDFAARLGARFTAALADRYRIEDEVARGGMATVYLAHDIRHDRPVAVKLLNPELTVNLATQRFLGEIRMMAQLSHPHILPLFDSGQADELLYYVMPFIEGETLRARIRRERQLPVDDAVRITREIASALDHAHAHGIIHRDVKPENVLLQDGTALVMDFGIALALSAAGDPRITRTGIILGSPQYMSPEQARGEKVLDARSDIYSLGCLLYEMLTGHVPCAGPTPQVVLARMEAADIEPVRAHRPRVPREIEDALMTALAPDPAHRFASARAMAEALSGEPGAARLAPPSGRGARTLRVWQGVAIVAALLSAIAIWAALSG
jgi:serine/threonine-protein kinase